MAESLTSALRTRVAAVERYNADTFDYARLGPRLTGLLDWITTHPEGSGEFETVFTATVDACVEEARKAGVPPATEILEYCMHTLRYPQVRRRLEEIRAGADTSPTGINTRRWAERILEAYADDWEVVRIGLLPPYPGSSEVR